MSKLCLVGAVMCALAVIALPQSALAVTITSGAETLFSDGFEADTPAGAGGAGDADPAKWYVTEEWDVANQVLTATHQNVWLPSGPFEGEKYYKIYAPNGANYNRAPLSRTTTAADTHVHVEWMMYVPSSLPSGATPEWGGFFNLSYQSAGNGWQGRTWSGLRRTTGTVHYYDGAWKDTGLSWTYNKWQKWELDYYPDADPTGGYIGSYTVTIDGASTGSITQFDQSGYAVRYFFINGGSAKSVLDVDATPEPATLLLLGLGGLVAIRRRRCV